jgi:hypothetical protein
MDQKIYHDKRLVNGAMHAITEIICPLLKRAQIYDQDIPGRYGEYGVYQIDAMTVQLPAKPSCGKTERRMLTLILCWGCKAPQCARQ